MTKLTPLQRDWFKDTDGPHENIDNHRELVKKCPHKVEPQETGVTGRDYCPRCGKVLDISLTQYKYND